MIAAPTGPMPKLLASATTPDRGLYSMVVADTPAEVLAAQRLRRHVFAGELGARLAGPSGVDVDGLDEHCDHLVVKVEPSGEVVGAYRILPPGRAGRPAALVGGGRGSCVAPEHRNGSVIGLMWAGLFRYVSLVGARWGAGCAPVPLADGGSSAASVRDAVLTRAPAPVEYRVTPRNPWRHKDVDRRRGGIALPPLMRGHLRLGAWVCGEPALDPGFGCADFLLLLAVDRMDPRYSRRFQ